MTNRDLFCMALAQDTGLDVNVIQAWAIEEEGWDATEESDLKNQDWLNIGYFDSGPGQIAFNAAFKTVAGGAEASAKFLRGTWGGASEGIRQILTSVGESPEAQCLKIGGSGWADNPDYGAQIYGVYKEIFAKGMQLTVPAVDPNHYLWFDDTRIALPHGINSERAVVENYDKQRPDQAKNHASLLEIEENLNFLAQRVRNDMRTSNDPDGKLFHRAWRLTQLEDRANGEQVVKS